MSAPEKALVFAAGLGTRMQPITLTLPKPLVRIGNRTMLDHVLDRLAELSARTGVYPDLGFGKTHVNVTIYGPGGGVPGNYVPM